jgi:hypothetical protein
VAVRKVCALTASLFVLLSVVGGAGPFVPRTADAADDRFGGIGPPVTKGSGAFQAMKVGNRWLLVTPEGRPFWMLGVFAVDFGTKTYGDRIQQKYAKPSDPPNVRGFNAQLLWGAQSCRRIKSWGFNTLAEYIATYASPLRDLVHPGTPAMPDDARLPAIALVRPSAYSLRNLNNLAPGPVKTLTLGIDRQLSPDVEYWRGRTTPDVFDPNFEAWFKGAVGGGGSSTPTPGAVWGWQLGVSTDDVDDIFGWGPGPDVPTGKSHPHIGWFALVTAPSQQDGAPHYGAFKDPKVYTKHALRDFLASRYGTVAALNAAWNARYTTLDSDGGWPGGRGLLDESGRNPWVGADSITLKPMTAAARKDLDDFLYLYAKQYFVSVTRPLRKGQPRGTAGLPLIMGPATFNGWAGLTRTPVLRAAGEYLDVVQANLTPVNIAATMSALGDVPVTTWQGLPANPDSALWKVPADWGVKTQAERGRAYREMIQERFNIKSPAGIHPVVGIKWWAWLDSYGEGRNFGLVSFLDNAYDGREAVRATGKDPWGYITGSEERDYGDFISGVREAHQRLASDVRDAVKAAAAR